MSCPKCNVSTNTYGIYKGRGLIRCLNCGIEYDHKNNIIGMDKAVTIGDRKIGPGYPCYLVGEIGINHNGDVDIAKHLIDIALQAGWDAVKFQKRTVNTVYTPDELAKPRESPFGSTNGDLKRRLEFGIKEYTEINLYCKKRGIAWFASGWDNASIDFLMKFNPPCLKISSACLTDEGLLMHARSKGVPIILSTGMSTLDQIQYAVQILGKKDLILLHTCSTYPSKYEELNLQVISTLYDIFGIPVGYSGHETGIPSTVAAVALGACMIERHITLDRAMWGSDQAASLGPSGIIQLARDIRIVEAALGSGIKQVLDSEIPVMKKLRRK